MLIRAEYVVRLSTPIYICPDLEGPVPSIKFDRQGFAVEINRWGFTSHQPIPDGGFDPGEMSAVSVRITGDEPGGLTIKALPSDIQEKYEGVLIASLMEFVNWVRIRTQQTHLNNRFPVREYDVVFFSEEGIISQQQTVKNPRRGAFSMHPDNFVGSLGSCEWQDIGESLRQGGPPHSVDTLVYQAKALLSEGFNGPALIIAVTALEYYCWNAIPEDKRFRNTHKGKSPKGVKELFKTLVEMIGKDAMLPIDGKLIGQIIERRNAVTHGREDESTRSDINYIIRAIRAIRRERSGGKRSVKQS